jgi:hypothetical protein
MPEIVADAPSLSCSLLLSEGGIQGSQSLSPDPFSPRARDARGRFAKGSSGNPQASRAAFAIPGAAYLTSWRGR